MESISTGKQGSERHALGSGRIYHVLQGEDGQLERRLHLGDISLRDVGHCVEIADSVQQCLETCKEARQLLQR